MAQSFSDYFWKKVTVQLMIAYGVAIPPVAYFFMKAFKSFSASTSLFTGLLVYMLIQNLVLQIVTQKNLSKKMRQVAGNECDLDLLEKSISSADSYPAKVGFLWIVCWLSALPIFIFSFIIFAEITGPEILVFILMMSANAANAWGLSNLLSEGIVLEFKRYPNITDYISIQENVQTGSIRKKIISLLGILVICPLVSIFSAFYVIRAQGLSVVSMGAGFILLVLQAVALSMINGFLLAGFIRNSVNDVCDFIEKLLRDEGNLTRRVPAGTSDEIGYLVFLFNKYLAVMQKNIYQISNSSKIVSTETENVNAITYKFTEDTRKISNQTLIVSTSTEEASRNLIDISSSADKLTSTSSAVATAIEEMNSSLSEIAQNCHREADIAQNAKLKANDSEKLMTLLNKSANAIGGILDIITDIAEQTNLLALNATIEAASAGDAGKGFAVVAAEVKTLSQQTAKATQNISEKINEIQHDSSNALSSLKEIVGVVEEVDTISHSIASAVEEQSATINEIAKNVAYSNTATVDISHNIQEASRGLTDISGNVQKINENAKSVMCNSDQLKTSISSLNNITVDLKGVVSQFKVQ